MVKKGSKILAFVAESMPAPSVVHAQAYIGALALCEACSGPQTWSGKNLIRVDGQCAPVRHRVAGIDRQVEQYLFELHGVGLHPTRRGVELQDDRDVFADQTLQQCP